MSILSDTLAHRRWLISYENGAVRKIVALYSRRTAPIVQRLESIDKQLSAGQPLTSAQAAQAGRDRVRLRRLYERLAVDVRSTMTASLQRAAETEIKTSARILNAGLPSGITARAPAVDIQTLINRPTGGQLWIARLEGASTSTIKTIDAALAISIDRGASIDDATRLVSTALGKVGQHQRAIARIVRTEIQRVSNQAAQATYRQNRDVIKSVRYLATLDSKVPACAVCRPLHRVTYDLDVNGQHRGPEIPQHPNCRCFYAPVTFSIAEIFARREG